MWKLNGQLRKRKQHRKNVTACCFAMNFAASNHCIGHRNHCIRLTLYPPNSHTYSNIHFNSKETKRIQQWRYLPSLEMPNQKIRENRLTLGPWSKNHYSVQEKPFHSLLAAKKHHSAQNHPHGQQTTTRHQIMHKPPVIHSKLKRIYPHGCSKIETVKRAMANSKSYS